VTVLDARQRSTNERTTADCQAEFCSPHIPTAPHSRWIPTTGMPGMTAQNSPESPQSTGTETVLFDGLHHVFAAGGLKPATRSQPGTDPLLVGAHSADDHQSGDTLDSAKHVTHPSRRLSCAVQFSRPVASVTSDSPPPMRLNSLEESAPSRIPKASRIARFERPLAATA